MTISTTSQHAMYRSCRGNIPRVCTLASRMKTNVKLNFIPKTYLFSVRQHCQDLRLQGLLRATIICLVHNKLKKIWKEGSMT
jgi:hypothetical protein